MNIKNINLENIIKIVLIIIAILIIIYYDKLFPSYNIKNTETFVEETLESNANNSDFANTVYERAVTTKFINTNDFVCDIIPTFNCDYRKQFPVHIIKGINGLYIAVFNDGKLYSTDNLRDGSWLGPYENSMPDQYIPLRNITTNPEGNKLIGIGYDNRIYIKSSNNILDLSSEWNAYPANINAIYATFYFNKDKNEFYLIVINTDGKIMKQVDENKFINVNNGNIPPLLKIFYDYNGYMLGLTKDFHLGRFDKKNWETSTFSKKTKLNSDSLLNDILYDNDMSLFGLVFNEDKKIMEIKKQSGVGYDKRFITLLKDEAVENKMIDENIIKSKLGTIDKLGLFTENGNDSIFDNDINIAYQRQVLEDNAKLRNFCKNRQNNIKTNMIDLELNNQIKENAAKISEINNLLNKLENNDI